MVRQPQTTEKGGASAVPPRTLLLPLYPCIFASFYPKELGYIVFNLFEKERKPVTLFCSLNILKDCVIFQVSLISFPNGSSLSHHTGRETREWRTFQRGHSCDRRKAASTWKKFLWAYPAQQCHPGYALLSWGDFWASGTSYQVRSSSW